MSKKQEDEREKISHHLLSQGIYQNDIFFEFDIQLKWCSKMVDINFGVLALQMSS